jgi:hypothetical protein
MQGAHGRANVMRASMGICLLAWVHLVCPGGCTQSLGKETSDPRPGRSSIKGGGFAFAVAPAQRFGRDSVYAHALPQGQVPPIGVAGQEPTDVSEVHTEADASAQRFGRDSVYASGTSPNSRTEEDEPRSSGSLAKVQNQPWHRANSILPSPDVPRDTSFTATLHNRQWVEELHRIRSSVETANRTDQQFVASAAIAVTTLSSGFIFWLLRGGLLLSSLMMSFPAWASLDPLPILAYRRRKARNDERHNDKVERMF